MNCLQLAPTLWIGLAAAVLKQWPSRLVQTCKEARVWRSWLLRDELNPSYAIERVAAEHLSFGFYNPCDAKIAARFWPTFATPARP